jgi:putative nucleotidyltransferase with HDIG domain
MVIKSPLSNEVFNQLLKTKYIEKYIELLNSCDSETKAHSVRVARLATDMGFELGLSIKDIKTLCLAGLLHDIGKIDISQKLLHTKGPLTAKGKMELSKHALYGARKIKGKRFKVVREIVRRHHDFHKQRTEQMVTVKRRKGSIPYLTEIVAVADVFDALTSTRSYKVPFGRRKVEHILRTEFSGNKSLVRCVLERY